MSSNLFNYLQTPNMEQNGFDTPGLSLKGLQVEMLLRLQKRTLSENQQGLVLAYPHGCGKTVACCVFFQRLSSLYPCSVNQLSQTETIKVRANKRTVLRAAKEINSFLCAIKSINDNDISKSRTCWQRTKQSWLTLTPGENVSYTTPVVAAYSCGTTLLHTVFLSEFLVKYKLDNFSGKRWLLLCGGSAAELIALKILSQKKGNEQQFESVTCVDINTWNGVCEKVWNHDNRFVFRQMDILSPENSNLLQEIVGNSDIVTLVYGLTEIHDTAPERAKQCINLVFNSLKENAKFLLLDPLKTCHGKDLWIDSIAEYAGLTEENAISGKRFKVCINEHDVCNSAVNPWIKNMDLRLNEDVKLSMHVWCRYFTKKGAQIMKPVSYKTTKRNENKSKIGIFVVNTTSKLKYARLWLEKAKMSSNLRIVDFGGLKTGETPQAIQSHLFHVLSSLKSCTSGFQVCLLTIKQLPNIRQNSELLQIFQNAFLSLIDDFDQYMPLNSPKKVKTVMQTLKEVLPPASRRIVVCPAHLVKIVAYAEQLCNTSAKDNHEDVLSSFPLNPFLMKEINGLNVDHCVADRSSECKGYISEENAAFVKFDNRVKEGSKTLMIFPKDLEHMTTPFPVEVNDVVLIGEKLVKFPKEKIHDLMFKAYGKIAYVGKQCSKMKEQNSTSFDDNHKKLKTGSDRVRIHLHRFA